MTNSESRTALTARLEDRAASYDQSGPSAQHTASLLREAALAVTALESVVDEECRRAEEAHAMTLRQSLAFETLRTRFADHYWDSLQSSKAVIMQHVAAVLDMSDAVPHQYSERRLCTDCGEPFEHAPNSGDRWRCVPCRRQY